VLKPTMMGAESTSRAMGSGLVVQFASPVLWSNMGGMRVRAFQTEWSLRAGAMAAGGI